MPPPLSIAILQKNGREPIASAGTVFRLSCCQEGFLYAFGVQALPATGACPKFYAYRAVEHAEILKSLYPHLPTSCAVLAKLLRYRCTLTSEATIRQAWLPGLTHATDR